jgi:two-component system OmpR family sensor kinase/two-component system sensor histidine kinase BaeS
VRLAWAPGVDWHDPAGRWPRRSRFVRRLAVILLLLLTLSAAGAGALVNLILRSTGFASGNFGAASALLSVLVVFAIVLMFFSWRCAASACRSGDRRSRRRVANGDYSTRVVERGPPFLRVVSRAFNGMTTRLQEQDRQRRDLLADIAHELRTPLAVVQGRLEGVLDGVYPRDDEQIGEVLEETRMLARLVEDLGTLAHAERGVMGLTKEPTDVSLLAYDAVRALEPETRARGVRVDVEAEADLGLVEVDPLRLREVVINLVANAILHSHSGAAVSLAVTQTGDWLVISVRDNGPGIAHEDLLRIFDRFHKGRRSQGSGLGLAIARQLVEAHDGEIGVESTVGVGTTFTVRIPHRTVGRV